MQVIMGVEIKHVHACLETSAQLLRDVRLMGGCMDGRKSTSGWMSHYFV